ncbi:MAG: zinc ribbon domain-containing protein [Candidatus Nitrospinota bacterium M3_3B_026]
MNADLERLVALQKLDTKIAGKEALLKSIPEELKQASAALEEARARLAEFDAETDADGKKRKELEREVDDLKEKIAKDKAKLPQVKTNVEYRAILKEQEGYENRIKRMEDEQLELMEKTDSRAPARAALEGEVAEEEKKFNSVKAEKEAVMARERAELDALLAERKSILSNITPSVLKNYERVSKSREGLGVVQVRDNLCQGCHQLIPPQLYYLVRTSDDIHRCPHCSRFIYFEREKTGKGVT